MLAYHVNRLVSILGILTGIIVSYGGFLLAH